MAPLVLFLPAFVLTSIDKLPELVFVILFFVLHWYLSLFSQTFFLHRYASHRAFTMNKAWEKFFFIFTWITQGSSYLSPRAYAVMHRMHHAYTDTDKDPHSPAYDTTVWQMMKRTRDIYARIFSHRFDVEERFTKQVPEWRWFDRMGNSAPSRLLWIAFYVFLYLSFAPSAWFLLLVPVHAAMGPIHGAIINWYAHKYGEVNFEVDNTSKNLFRFDWLMMGEGYHNNHHKFPARSNFAFVKGEFDPVYPIILFLKQANIIRMKKA